MAQLQENINGIVAAFYVCTRGDGNCSPLSREELRQLLEQEFGEVMENPQDPKTIKKVLCFLDDNSNCRVDFSELLTLVFQVAKACYKAPQQHQALEDDQELRAQEKADGELLLGLRAVGRVSHNQQVPDQVVNNQVQDTETQDTDKHQTQEAETPAQDQDSLQTQEAETAAQDQDNPQDGGTEALEGDPETAEILDTASPEQDRNKAEEIEMSEQDPKTHQVEETEAPGQGSDYPQSPEMESLEQDLTCPSETEGRDPNKTQVCAAPWQDPNPDETQNLLPPQQGSSPRWDPKLWGTQQDQIFHQLPESKVLEQEHSRAEAPSCPAQQQDVHAQSQPPLEQQLQQSLYQWPPQQ